MNTKDIEITKTELAIKEAVEDVAAGWQDWLIDQAVTKLVETNEIDIYVEDIMFDLKSVGFTGFRSKAIKKALIQAMAIAPSGWPGRAGRSITQQEKTQ